MLLVYDLQLGVTVSVVIFGDFSTSVPYTRTFKIVPSVINEPLGWWSLPPASLVNRFPETLSESGWVTVDLVCWKVAWFVSTNALPVMFSAVVIRDLVVPIFVGSRHDMSSFLETYVMAITPFVVESAVLACRIGFGRNRPVGWG